MTVRRRNSRAPRNNNSNPKCAITNVVLGNADPKVLVSDLGCKIYMGEDAFFRNFVFKICDQKNSKPIKQKKAAADIPGLVQCKSTKGVCWKLSLREFSRKTNVKQLQALLSFFPDDSPIRRRLCGGDERNRFMSQS